MNPAERHVFAGLQLLCDAIVNYQQLLDNELIFKANES